MPQEVCLSCWHLWRPRKENPRECPSCHSRKTTSLRDVIDTVDEVSKWLETDPLLECFFVEEKGKDWRRELVRKLESKRHYPKELILSPFRAARSLSTFREVVKGIPIPSREREDARRVIMEIAWAYNEKGDVRVGDFVEDYIENLSEDR